LEKLLSRKFLVTIVTIVAALTGLNLDNWHIAVVAGVAAVYVIAEALVDQAGAKQIADDVQKGLAIVGSIDASKLDAGTLKTLLEKLGTAPPISPTANAQAGPSSAGSSAGATS
jgi:hypothetical protein